MDKTYSRFVVTVSASVEDINALSENVERLSQALVDDISDKCTAYTGSTIRVKLKELEIYDYSQYVDVCPLDHKELSRTGVDVCPECLEVTTCATCGGTGRGVPTLAEPDGSEDGCAE